MPFLAETIEFNQICDLGRSFLITEKDYVSNQNKGCQLNGKYGDTMSKTLRVYKCCGQLGVAVGVAVGVRPCVLHVLHACALVFRVSLCEYCQ